MTCEKCHGTGLTKSDDFWLSWCDCPTGRVVWNAALGRAVSEISFELTAGPQS